VSKQTYKVLSIRQPWAHLILNGIKPVENRTWSTRHRGLLLIHAPMTYHHDPELEQRYRLDPDELIRGAVLGVVELVDIVTDHRSPFFCGPFGWVLKNPRRVRPVPLNGRLGLFETNLNLKG
jgi:hypothetical protein